MNNRKKILIVEDNEDDQILFVQAFSEYCDKIDLTFKDSALKALNAMALENFDFFLVDFRLGVFNAHDVIKRLMLFGCPFAVISGYPEEEVKSELCDVSKDIRVYSKGNLFDIPELINESLE